MEQRSELIEAQCQAAAALDTAAKLAKRAELRGVNTQARERGRACSSALVRAVGTPNDFWAAACSIEGQDFELGTLSELKLALNYAAARLAVGDMAFVRESLVGQASWASLLAVRLAIEADSERSADRVALLKLALVAQRQAAQALATAAALNKLTDGSVTVVD